MTRKTIVALYDRRVEAEAMRQALLDEGFDDLNIEVVSDGGFGGSNDFHGGLFVLLSGWGVLPEEAHEYAEAVRQGGALLVVSLIHTSAVRRALSILESDGARTDLGANLGQAAAAMRDVNAAPAPEATPAEGPRVGVYPIPDEDLGPTGRRRQP